MFNQNNLNNLNQQAYEIQKEELRYENQPDEDLENDGEFYNDYDGSSANLNIDDKSRVPPTPSSRAVPIPSHSPKQMLIEDEMRITSNQQIEILGGSPDIS